MMYVPTVTQCEHDAQGRLLSVVVQEGAARITLYAQRAEERPTVPAELLNEACRLALVISGHYHPNTPVDPWLAGHEKRLRELERISMNNGSKS